MFILPYNEMHFKSHISCVQDLFKYNNCNFVLDFPTNRVYIDKGVMIWRMKKS